MSDVVSGATAGLPVRLVLALAHAPTRDQIAMEMGMESCPCADEDDYEGKEAQKDWERRYFTMIERDTRATFAAEWRVRFAWADAAREAGGKA